MIPWKLLGPQLAVAAGLLGSLSLGLLVPPDRATDRTPYRAARILAALALLAGLTLLSPCRTGGGAMELVRLDGISASWQLIFLLGALPLVLLMEASGGLSFVLAMGAVLGMGLAASANHLFALFLGLELMSLPTYLLILNLRRDRRGIEAAVKYFFCGAAASALYLMGLSIYYAAVGSFTMTPAEQPRAAAALGLVLMGSAAIFKVGAFPMQFWLPDVYEASPPELSGFMSTTVKAAGFLILLRLLAMARGGIVPGLQWWLPGLSVATMTLGNLLALRQGNLQRLLAYSSIAHVGYLLAGVWAWGADPSAGPPATVYIYLAAYLFMNTGAFLFLKITGVSELRHLRGLAGRHPGPARQARAASPVRKLRRPSSFLPARPPWPTRWPSPEISAGQHLHPNRVIQSRDLSCSP